MGSLRRLTLVALLATALVAEAVVLYAVTGPLPRFVLGMAIAVVAVVLTLSLARRGFGLEDEVAPGSRFHTRRFIRLRSYVEQFLEQVRHLHRLAVDADRGVRDRASADEEMDEIEQRLLTLVRDIRSAAGVEEYRTSGPTARDSNPRQTPARRP